MSDNLEAILREFADRIRASVRQEMIEAITGDHEVGNGRRGPGRPPRSLAGNPVVSKRRKGAKRDPREIQGLAVQLASAIKAGPGHRIEQLGKMLEVSTRDLALPVKKLLAEKKIRKTGTRRATKYFPK